LFLLIKLYESLKKPFLEPILKLLVMLDFIVNFLPVKEMNQCDMLLHTIQKQKMKELWDNGEDEVWENYKK